MSKAMEALKVSAEQAESFSGLSYEMGGVRVTAMAAGRYFALERWELTSDYQGLMDGSRFDVLTVIAGQGRIETLKPDQTVSLNRGTTVLFPAALGAYQILPSPELVLLRSFVPDLEADVVLPLRKRGFYLADIRKLAGWRRPNDLSIFSENNK
ncbi:MAG TPA: hypothetical protein ENH70_10005 [Desulfobacteraceae bacterium]|nr:hypothetical protein [Desulfobacteraceae bacterium]